METRTAEARMRRGRSPTGRGEASSKPSLACSRKGPVAAGPSRQRVRRPCRQLVNRGQRVVQTDRPAEDPIREARMFRPPEVGEQDLHGALAQGGQALDALRLASWGRRGPFEPASPGAARAAPGPGEARPPLTRGRISGRYGRPRARRLARHRRSRSPPPRTCRLENRGTMCGVPRSSPGPHGRRRPSA
jgi:hypothetical protein